MSFFSAVCHILLWCMVTRLPANMSMVTTSEDPLVWQLVKQDSLPKDSIFTIPVMCYIHLLFGSHTYRLAALSRVLKLDWIG